MVAGGLRPSSVARPPPFVVLFVLGLNQEHILAYKTAYVLRLNTVDVLDLNKAHILRLNNKIFLMVGADVNEAAPSLQ